MVNEINPGGLQQLVDITSDRERAELVSKLSTDGVLVPREYVEQALGYYKSEGSFHDHKKLVADAGRVALRNGEQNWARELFRKEIINFYGENWV